MQFTIITTLALAMAVTAAPAEVVVRTNGGSNSVSQCNAGSSVACCKPTGGLLGLSILDCLVGVLSCDGGSAQCCKTSSSVSVESVGYSVY